MARSILGTSTVLTDFANVCLNSLLCCFCGVFVLVIEYVQAPIAALGAEQQDILFCRCGNCALDVCASFQTALSSVHMLCRIVMICADACVLTQGQYQETLTQSLSQSIVSTQHIKWVIRACTLHSLLYAACFGDVKGQCECAHAAVVRICVNENISSLLE